MSAPSKEERLRCCRALRLPTHACMGNQSTAIATWRWRVHVSVRRDRLLLREGTSPQCQPRTATAQQPPFHTQPSLRHTSRSEVNAGLDRISRCPQIDVVQLVIVSLLERQPPTSRLVGQTFVLYMQVRSLTRADYTMHSESRTAFSF